MEIKVRDGSLGVFHNQVLCFVINPEGQATLIRKVPKDSGIPPDEVTWKGHQCFVSEAGTLNVGGYNILKEIKTTESGELCLS